MAAAHSVLPPKAAYDLWAATYPPTAHNPLMRTEQAAIAAILATVHPARALDIGTGSGRYLPLLAATGATTVVGLDFSPAMLARGLRNDPGGDFTKNVKSPPGSFLVCADARRLPFADATFDLVNASLMAGDVSDLAAWATGIARVLAPRGHLVYSDFHPSWMTYGWQRTFQSADGRTFDLPFVPHRIDEHLAALDRAGLTLRALLQPRVLDRDDDEAAASKFRARWGNPPVVVVVHAMKAAR